MMDAKDFLKRIRLLDKKVKAKQREFKRMEIEAESVKASSFCERVQSSSNSSKVENAVVELDEYKNEIDRDIQELIKYKRKVMKKVDMLEDPDEVDILYRRYFEFMKWEDISEATSFSARQVHNIHGSALENFKKVMTDDEWLES